MLNVNDREKLENRINEIISEISSSAFGYCNAGLSSQQIIERVVNTTVNKLTPESKMLLNSVCNMMENNTFKSELYNNAEVKAAYYALDIRSDFTKRFSFDVPKNIDYKESENSIKTLVASGAVIVVGGAVSIAVKSIVPVCIAVVIAAVMAFVLHKCTNKATSSSIKEFIQEYLQNVKNTIMKWFDEIERYYDEKISKFEENYGK